MATEQSTTELPKPVGVVPYLILGGAGGIAAIDFYEKAFGAEVVHKAPAEDGRRLMHAHLRINGGSLMFSDAFPEHGCPAQPPAATILHIDVEDADAAWSRALAAGAEVTMPLDNQFWGQRYGQVRDPFGFTWSIGGPVKP
jgi:PhnB protein